MFSNICVILFNCFLIKKKKKKCALHVLGFLAPMKDYTAVDPA